MAHVLGGRQTVPLEEVALAQAFQLEALMNVLERLHRRGEHRGCPDGVARPSREVTTRRRGRKAR